MNSHMLSGKRTPKLHAEKQSDEESLFLGVVFSFFAELPMVNSQIAGHHHQSPVTFFHDQTHHVEFDKPRRFLRRRQKLGLGFSPVRLG
jgi:hypothetical protein